MRTGIQFVGLFLLLEGISGTIDRLAWQPFFGVVLNAFNRFVVPRLEFLTGYEVFANLILAALGAVIVIAAERAQGLRRSDLRRSPRTVDRDRVSWGRCLRSRVRCGGRRRGSSCGCGTGSCWP